MDKSNVVYKILCLADDCIKYYVGQTGRGTGTRMNEHKQAVRRHDPLSLISIHQDATGHTMDLDAPIILTLARTKHEREYIESWYSDDNAINKHIDLEPIYHSLRAKDLAISARLLHLSQ